MKTMNQTLIQSVCDTKSQAVATQELETIVTIPQTIVEPMRNVRATKQMYQLNGSSLHIESETDMYMQIGSHELPVREVIVEWQPGLQVEVYSQSKIGSGKQFLQGEFVIDARGLVASTYLKNAQAVSERIAEETRRAQEARIAAQRAVARYDPNITATLSDGNTLQINQFPGTVSIYGKSGFVNVQK